MLQGQAVLRELALLVESNFRPRVVVSHAGMGLGLFIKELLPETVHIGYFEWYFKNATTKHLLANFDLDTQLKTGLRNLPILQELESCDIGVVPTGGKKPSFPSPIRQTQVIFDELIQASSSHMKIQQCFRTRISPFIIEKMTKALL